MSRYGSGSIYKRGDIFWVTYRDNGIKKFESSQSTVREDASRLLNKRLAEVAKGETVADHKVTVGKLLDMVEQSYKRKKCASLPDLCRKIARLRAEFGSIPARKFGTQEIEAFRDRMEEAGKAQATTNRYLAIVRRGFYLGQKHHPHPLVSKVPDFGIEAEKNARQGFLEDDQYLALLRQLPEHLKGVLIFGYNTGLRRQKLVTLRRDQVDWENEVIRLEAVVDGKTIGTVHGWTEDMKAWLNMQRAVWSVTPGEYLFTDAAGNPVGNFTKAWKSACKRAGVEGLLVHDLRRSAVRNMELAGVPRSHAMKITGHKLENTYKRYSISNDKDTAAVAKTLDRHRRAKQQERMAEAALEARPAMQEVTQ